MNGLLYVVGGDQLGRYYMDSDPVHTDTAECYNPSIGQWRALPNMHESRSFCAAACEDGLLYVVGGYNDKFNGTSREPKPLNTVECYNPLTSLWRVLPNMSVARLACAAACADGLLYVVGGCSEAEAVASAECYDISTETWQPLPEMHVPRGCSAAVCLDGLLYVIGGGHIDISRGLDPYGGRALASVEVYNPLTREWQALPDMSVPRRGCAAACLDGLLYVAGGRSDQLEELASAECYDPISRQWRSLPDMSIPRVSCAVAALPTWGTH
jgi:N-acetylneuraminic acid mutarotase